MLPLYRYAIEDCPFSQFALNPALFKRFVYYDNLVYHQRMKYHWKEENLIFYSKPLVRFSDHRLLDGNPNPFQDTIMTLHHQGGCIVKSWFQIHFQLPWKPLDPHFQYYWAKKILDHWFALCTAFHGLTQIQLTPSPNGREFGSGHH